MSLTTEYLERRGVAFETFPHDAAFTTIDEARALGIQADQLVKTLLLDTERGHALAVIPGDRRLEMHRVARAVGDPTCVWRRSRRSNGISPASSSAPYRRSAGC